MHWSPRALLTVLRTVTLSEELAKQVTSRRVLIGGLTILACSAAVSPKSYTVHKFDEPIDALSIGVPTDVINLQVSAKVNREWLPWQSLELEKEFDPTLRESNLVTFPVAISEVRVRGATEAYEVHPLRVSDQPVSYLEAALTPRTRPTILLRDQWGADDSLLYNGKANTRSDEPDVENGISNGKKTEREIECEQWEKEYPEQFQTTRTVGGDSGGTFRWPLRYSPEVNILTVHHTASRTTGDARTGVERMRLLYQYHAKNRGWGDVGYHYIIDENGQIYEGRQGGAGVVGGHAYCSNVGTVGVALMGNFDEEQPTQAQMQASQWLLRRLADQYKINVSQEVSYHGKVLSPIVGHGDLVTTACPGFFIRETLTQVRKNVRSGITGNIRFPVPPWRSAVTRRGTTTRIPTAKIRLIPSGSLDVTGRPGAQTVISLLLQAEAALNPRERIADVVRSDRTIGVWQDVEGREMRVRDELILPQRMRTGEAVSLRVRIQLPQKEGTYTLTIDDIPYVLTVSGRPLSDQEKNIQEKAQRTSSPLIPSTPTRPGLLGLVPQRAKPTTVQSKGPPIRIRLGWTGDVARIAPGNGAKVNGRSLAAGSVQLEKTQAGCRASQNGTEIALGIIRIDSPSGIHTVESWDRSSNRFRGAIECQMVDGQLALINELPLEDYLAGLAEEPDSEPYEKQRAFAVAARSYAAFYVSAQNRKFPGKPYDGDDSPARFQAYGGAVLETANPAWVRAVRSTSGFVLKKDGQTVKTPYFSSDSGRTKSPDEVRWPNFPFAEVFLSKPDPWCKGLSDNGHGVGMSGCGSEGQANEGKIAEQILEYYYPGTKLESLSD